MKPIKNKIKKKIKYTLLVLMIALIFMMMLAAGYFMYCNVNDKVAFVGKYALVKVTTPSMEPTIPAGTYIITEKIDADAVKTNDVILFYSRDAAIYGKINTHRVVEIVNENDMRSFVTRGDHNAANDSPLVLPEDVIGRYIKNAENLTAFADFISKSHVFLLMMIIPSALLIAFSIKDVIKGFREVRMEKLVKEEVEKLKELHKNDDGKDSTDNV